MSFFTTSDGVKLHYTDTGEGKPLVLISGYSAPCSVWRFQEKAYTDKGYRVVALDRRSHGESENSLQGQHLCRHAADVHELIELLKLEKPVLVGHSMGASTVFAYLSIFGDRELSAAVGIDQTPCMLNKPGWDLGMYNFNLENMATFFDAPIPGEFHRDPADGYLEAAADIIETAMKFDLVRTKPLLLDHAYADWRDVFPTLEIPVFFLAAENSIIWSCEHAVASADLCRRGSYKVIHDCGHDITIERPDECAAAILEFLDREVE